MGTDVPKPTSWRRSRYGFAVFWFSLLLTSWTALRLVLLLAFTRPAALPLGEVLRAIAGGFQRDLFMALIGTIPLLLWFLIVPERAFRAKWHRALFWSASFVLCFGQVFLLFI